MLLLGVLLGSLVVVDVAALPNENVGAAVAGLAAAAAAGLATSRFLDLSSLAVAVAEPKRKLGVAAGALLAGFGRSLAAVASERMGDSL